MPMLTVAADSSVRYLIAQDPAFDAMTFDVNNPGHYAKRLHELSELESSDLNLSAFAKRGGKILILHGTDDLVVSRSEERRGGKERASTCMYRWPSANSKKK